jgi:hypothetical protein
MGAAGFDRLQRHFSFDRFCTNVLSLLSVQLDTESA